MISVNLVYDVKWMFNFGKKAIGIENLLRRKTNHKMFVFSMGQLKTFVVVYIIIYYTIPTFAVPQLLLTIILNPSNILWAWRLKPLPMLWCINLTTLAKVTDGIAMAIMYAQLAQTEINPPNA